MKTTLATSLSIFSLVATSALAGHERQETYAKVTHVSPVYENIEHRTPRQSCWVEQVREEERVNEGRRSAAPALIGGIIGGVIGNEVGRGGDNKKIGAVVGSVLGMSIASDIQRHSNRHHGGTRVSYRDVERCNTVYDTEQERVLQGYDVSYRFLGREYQTFTREHPGDRLRVAVDVRPLDR